MKPEAKLEAKPEVKPEVKPEIKPEPIILPDVMDLCSSADESDSSDDDTPKGMMLLRLLRYV